MLRQGGKEAALLQEHGMDVQIMEINKVYILIISESSFQDGVSLSHLLYVEYLFFNVNIVYVDSIE